MNLRDPQTQRLLLGTILLVGLGYAFYEYLYTPRQVEILELRAQAERLEGYNESAKRAAQSDRITALEEESVGYARRLETFEELIPTTEQVPQLLERVASAALESDVDLLAFTPLPAEPGSFYTEQFYDVEVRGGYHEIGTFLTRVATLPRIVRPAVTELIGEAVPPSARARVDPNAPPPPPETVVHAKLQLSTFVLPGGEAPVAGDTSAVKSRAIQLGTTGAPNASGTGASVAPTAAPSAAPSAAPALTDQISPGVAPAVEAERARMAAAAAQAGAPGAAPPASVGAAGPGTTAAPATGAAGAGAAPASPPAPASTGPAAPLSMPGDLPTVGERDAPSDDGRPGPGDLPPVGE